MEFYLSGIWRIRVLQLRGKKFHAFNHQQGFIQEVECVENTIRDSTSCSRIAVHTDSRRKPSAGSSSQQLRLGLRSPLYFAQLEGEETLPKVHLDSQQCKSSCASRMLQACQTTVEGSCIMTKSHCSSGKNLNSDIFPTSSCESTGISRHGEVSCVTLEIITLLEVYIMDYLHGSILESEDRVGVSSASKNHQQWQLCSDNSGTRWHRINAA